MPLHAHLDRPVAPGREVEATRHLEREDTCRGAGELLPEARPLVDAERRVPLASDALEEAIGIEALRVGEARRVAVDLADARAHVPAARDAVRLAVVLERELALRFAHHVLTLLESQRLRHDAIRELLGRVA